MERRSPATAGEQSVPPPRPRLASPLEEPVPRRRLSTRTIDLDLSELKHKLALAKLENDRFLDLLQDIKKK